MDLKELIEECQEKQKQFYRNFRNRRYFATGQYYMGELTEQERDKIIQSEWEHYKELCTLTLYGMAHKSGHPLVKWMAFELSNKDTAFNLIKRLPMDLKEIDALAVRSNMACGSYAKYRKQALEAGVVSEYR